MNAITLPSPETPLQAARRFSGEVLCKGYKLTALYEYKNADGSPWCWRIRCDHLTKDKWIRPMHWNGIEYTLGEPPVPVEGKPLYRLPELLAADPKAIVWITEGEKCVDKLHKLGLIATTSGSSSSAATTDWTPLRVRTVRIWPDNDAAGIKYAQAVKEKLEALSVQCNIVYIAPLGLPEKGDCIDWLTDHPKATAADVLALATLKAEPVDGVELIDAATLKPEPIRWLWPGWLARGKLHVLAGAPGTGKTTLAMDFAAAVSAGRALPSGYRPQRGNVLIWSGEDSTTDTLVPRLIAAGADLTRIQFVGEVIENGQHFPFDPARDVPRLAASAASIGDIALLIVDPLVSAISGDSHKNAEVRRGLAPLVDFAAQRDAALLGITHYSKGTQGREPLERVSGSLAFGALARMVFGTVQQQPEGNDAQRKMLLARAKSNIGPDGSGFVYAFEQIELVGHPGLMASRIAWGTAVEGTARELLTEVAQEDTERSESGECVDWLRNELLDGERDAASMLREGRKIGYTSKTIRRAREKLGIKPHKASFNTGWVWTLPIREDAHFPSEDTQEAQRNEVGALGERGHLRVESKDVDVFDI